MIGRLLAALALLALLAAPAAAQEADGVIAVEVTNGTAGGAVPAGARAALLAFRSGEIVGRHEGQVDSEGRLRFAGLDTSPDLTYGLAVQYQGVPYVYPTSLSFKDDPPAPVELTVYETTTDASALRFERAGMLVAEGPDQITVLEMGAVLNGGDRAVVPGPDRPYTVRFGLPPGATELTPQRGFTPAEVASLGDGFAISRAIPPGRTEYAFSYLVPAPGGVAALGKALYLPADSLALYVPDRGQAGPRAASPQLAPAGSADLGGQRYLVQSASNVPAGQQLAITVSGLASDFRRTPTDPGVFVGLTVFVALLGSLVILSVLRGRSPPAPAAAARGQGPGPSGLEGERRALLEQLAELDDRYQAGGLAENEYRAEREPLKARLVLLTRLLREGERA